jgi:hypothetical protein
MGNTTPEGFVATQHGIVDLVMWLLAQAHEQS